MEVKWHDKAPEGKLDLLVTLDFRMSTTCLVFGHRAAHGHLVRKDDLNTSDMHPFIHPLSAAVDAPGRRQSDWEIYKGFAKSLERSVRRPPGRGRGGAHPIMHDSPAELAQPFDVKDWKKGEMRA